MRVLTIFLLLAMLVAGCNLFKKTSKTSSSASQTASKQSEADMLVLKNADKETQVFTYWNDSGLYQFQQIKEKRGIAKAINLATNENKIDKKENHTKQIEPTKYWIYIGLGLMVVGCYVLLKKR
ncbi:hypothetical protein HDC92_001386 [Pedobacter sp. AK017]|uniref:hypothetical protein n=1 Tax=Pedobacter sp. AK017 TaxID=2723073 RepID=UPI001613D283|nr:hypothetical protein [Pedobacter sp. AK017]MBB5437712.1 hypothetical protein [Pedobacter sp. AK017]